MKTIDQDEFFDIKVKVNDISGLYLRQSDSSGDIDNIWIDKKGAKQLIEILKEFVNEN